MAKAKSATKSANKSATAATKSATKSAKKASSNAADNKPVATKDVEESTETEQLPELPKLTEEDRKESAPKKSVTSSALNQTSSANPTGERSAEDQKIMKERLKAKK